MNNNRIYLILGCLVLLLLADIFYEVNFIKINRVEVRSTKVAQEIKIVQITDLHNKKFFNNNRQIYEDIRKINPDFIVLTGDMIDRKTKDYSYIYSFLNDLMKINQHVYYLMGNHELSHWNIGAFEKELSKMGIVLIDNRVDLYKDIEIYGDGYSKKADNVFSLELVHNPLSAIDNNQGFDLVLAGHTHGGQVRLPLISAFYAPGQGIFPKYSKGLYKINDSLLYVDSGLGNTFLPIRLFNQSQISFIDIIPLNK